MTSFPPGTHVRVHPLLHWTEVDVWRYTQRENIPLIDLYFAKNGKRYRSLGDAGHHQPDRQRRQHPRSRSSPSWRRPRWPSARGRAMDHEAEDAFERLRAAGYM